MRDELLFVVAPRLAAFCCVAAVVLSNLTGRRPNRTPADRNGSGDLLARACRYSIAAILVGHVVAFAFPAAVLLWDRSLVRLIVLESVGLAAAVVALVSLMLIIVRHVARHRSSIDTVAATLLLLQIVSGLTIAVRYRWASSWAEVTLTPYLHSLLGLKPSVVLVARMPFLVQLHVFCAFAILAIVPLSRMASPLIASLQDLARRPVLRLPRPLWRAVPAWTAVDVPVATKIPRDENLQH